MNTRLQLPSLWVLIGEAEVLATQGYSMTQDGVDLGLYVRNILGLRGLPGATIPAPYRISMKCESEQFGITMKACRETLQGRLLAILSRLDVFGDSPLTATSSPESALEYAERVLDYGETLLRVLERGAAPADPDRPEISLGLFRSVLGQLARQLSERLSSESAFYDAIAQSVRIPTDAELTIRHWQRNDDLWLVPAYLS
jgi:hypothetical protein